MLGQQLGIVRTFADQLLVERDAPRSSFSRRGSRPWALSSLLSPTWV